MLNRKVFKASNGAATHNNGGARRAAKKPARRRFIISAKAAAAQPHPPVAAPARRGRPPKNQANAANAAKAAPGKPLPGAPKGGGTPGAPGTPAGPGQAADLTEAIKTLLHLAHENGHVTYDDINDVLPDGLTPEDLDELYTKLRNLDVEIVDHAEVERAKPAEPEEEEDSRLEVLDDPVRMYMNQMGKVPLLTREQEVEICKRIEEAESEMKRLVYSLGFTAKEHIAIAEKLLSEPPKERFDRAVVDKKVANREGHLKDLRNLIKKVRVLDASVDESYLVWQKSATAGRREKARHVLQKLDKKLQDSFPKFFYKQKVLEDMIVVAGNVHEKFKASLRHVEELEARRKSADQQAALNGERTKIRALEQFVRMPQEEFFKTFDLLKRAADRAHQAKTHMAEANL